MNEDKLLTVEEAAERLNVSEDWLYRHAKEFPFSIWLTRRKLRFSSKGIDRYIEEKLYERHGTCLQAR